MIKFIIEAEEEFIHQFVDLDSIREKEKKGGSAIAMMMDMLSFITIEKKMKDGITEFIIKPNTSDKEAFTKAYEQAVSCAAAAFLVADIESEKENKEPKDEGTE